MAKLSIKCGESFVTKSEMAKRYGIDRRTFRKRMYQTYCAGALMENNQVKYDDIKKFTPAQIKIIYEHLGPPA